MRIDKRKAERAEQIRIRMEREKERQAIAQAERARKEAEEEAKIKEIEEAKLKAIQNMAQTGQMRQNRRAGGKQTEKEKKRKALAERRKPLNVDHLNTQKLKDKAAELQEVWHVGR